MADANVVTVIGTLGGFLLAEVSGWLKDRRAAGREEKARQGQQRAKIEERRVAFQRQNLLDLQTAVMESARLAGRVHFTDTMSFRKTGAWKKELLPAELDDGWRSAQMRTSLLKVRVSDDRIREMVDQFKNELVNLAVSDEQRRSETGVSSIMGILESLNERIGEVLRKFDEDEVVPQATSPSVVRRADG